MEAKKWNTQVFINERGNDTYVRAVLTTQDGTTIEGTGHARRNPADRAVPEIGDELAAGRAFLDLGHRLVTLAGADIEQAQRLG
ncbi:DUF1876 domain-containing protein [Actinomadura rugatobispora]|uniref:DUF1876 domain-containing protein n=1 Tax=Actinomadura rugatobispora TaxID=1994 RepID=A0ABW1A0J7_9ACTN|nr:DUF1876 domain-containing protein [Actinomadura rugatobispora]